ncbi:MAG: sulfatase-like hydrolase/transferase [Planctomycetia bacterium]|nr:sulfatase-like hydrolase/transferase [Planctomycetia bacterium]
MTGKSSSFSHLVSALIPLVLSAAASNAAAAPVHTEKPNIIMVLLDDVGTGWIPPYAESLTPEQLEPEILADYAKQRTDGVPVSREKHLDAARRCMPFLSSLARDGAVFGNCFATASLCAPSRAGLLTGNFQQRWGAYSNMDVDRNGIPASRVMLAEPLSAAGYRCGIIGKWHVAMKDPALRQHSLAYQTSSHPGQHPLDRGFGYYFGFNNSGSSYYEAKGLWENRSPVPLRPKGEFLTDLFNRKACEFVETALKAKQPLFLYYAPMTLHDPIVAPPERCVRPFDTGVNKLFGLLTHYGQQTNTLFILSSDNGCAQYSVPPHNAPNRGGKGTGWLGGVNVPLIVWQPGVVKPGRPEGIVSLADLMPTVLASAGAAVPANIDGKNLLPLLRGETARAPRDSLGSCGCMVGAGPILTRLPTRSTGATLRLPPCMLGGSKGTDCCWKSLRYRPTPLPASPMDCHPAHFSAILLRTGSSAMTAMRKNRS